MPTNIGYLDETWNMVLGCEHRSPGCVNCWAEGVSHTHASHPNPKISEPYEGITKYGNWTGKVKCLEDRLDIPLHWRKPRVIGVSFMADLFHQDVPFAFWWKVMQIIKVCPQHTFIMLTKRPERMEILYRHARTDGWLYNNLWLGVSVEDQKTADERIPLLLRCEAAKRIISYEPALDHIGITEYLKNIDLVVMGGESGPNARPMDVRSARAMLNQCLATNTSFYMKQMSGGEPIPKDLLKREFPA